MENVFDNTDSPRPDTFHALISTDLSIQILSHLVTSMKTCSLQTQALEFLSNTWQIYTIIVMKLHAIFIVTAKWLKRKDKYTTEHKCCKILEFYLQIVSVGENCQCLPHFSLHYQNHFHLQIKSQAKY